MSQSAKKPKPQGGSRESSAKGAARNGWPRAAGESVLGEAKAAFARAGFNDVALLLHWPEIVGPPIARVAQPLRWAEDTEGAVLTLKCEAGAAVLLQHQTRQIVDALNLYLGAGRVARVKFVSGRLTALSPAPAHPAPGHDAGDQAPDLVQALSRLASLRQSLARPRKRRAASPPD